MSLIIGRMHHSGDAPSDDFGHTVRGRIVDSRTTQHSIDLQGEIVASRYFRFKPWLDRPLAALLLVPGVPLILILILIVKLTSHGPGIYRQRRVGRGGKLFYLYKLRTMRHDAETATGPVWAVPNDPRLTTVGRWLRRFHLDELPQLLNVLRGEMSLVGPRPERPEFVAVLREVVPGYEKRTYVCPGVTGLAQLNLPPDRDVCSVCRKLVLDLAYVQGASLLLDLRILLCTIVAIPKWKWCNVVTLFRLRRYVEIAGQCRGRNRGTNGEMLSPDEIACPVTAQINNKANGDPVARRMLHRAAPAHCAASTSTDRPAIEPVCNRRASKFKKPR